MGNKRINGNELHYERTEAEKVNESVVPRGLESSNYSISRLFQSSFSAKGIIDLG